MRKNSFWVCVYLEQNVHFMLFLITLNLAMIGTDLFSSKEQVSTENCLNALQKEYFRDKINQGIWTQLFNIKDFFSN